MSLYRGFVENTKICLVAIKRTQNHSVPLGRKFLDGQREKWNQPQPFTLSDGSPTSRHQYKKINRNNGTDQNESSLSVAAEQTQTQIQMHRYTIIVECAAERNERDSIRANVGTETFRVRV